MNEFTGGERRYKPSAVKLTKGKVSRGVVTGAIIGASIIGAGTEAATGVVGKAVGKLGQGVNKVVRMMEDLDDRDLNASSAGIPSQKVSEGMQKAGIPVPQLKK